MSTTAHSSHSSDVDASFTAHRAGATTRGKSARRWLAKWCRCLHIYLSLFGLASILFFSVTGLTLNHPSWFFQEHMVQLSGTVPTKWLHLNARPPDDWDESDFSHEVAKLEVAEFLRAEHALRGQVSDFLVFHDECELTFEGPGYAAIARIERSSGAYSLEMVTNDFVTILNDLHKGRHSGTAWRWVIDISAIVGVIVAVSGFLLVFFLRLRRRAGIVTAIVGCAVLAGMYLVARS